MIGRNQKDNQEKKPNSREMEKLRSDFPQFFSKDGEFKLDRFKEFLEEEDIDIENEGYELKFLGKSYAKYIGSLETETYISPDSEHNAKEENKDSENLYIVGDNIDALKHLLGPYTGKIKCIYIDPPYNTGSDGFVYPDNFQFSAEDLSEKIGITEEEAGRILRLTGKSTHSAWLTFMYPRLALARALLSEDGVIFISIDDNEQANLKLICDEIFGEENFISQIIVQSNKRGQTYKEIAKSHEYLLTYTKSSDAIINQIETDKEFSKKDNISGFSERELRNRNPKFGKFNRPNLFYPIYVNPFEIDSNGYSPVSLSKNERFSVEVYPLNSEGKESCWRWGKERLSKNIKRTTMENSIVARTKQTGEYGIYEKYRNPKVTVKTIWFEDDLYLEHGGIWDDTAFITEKGSIELKNLGLDNLFPFPKPIELLKLCIQLSTQYNSNDIILDFFSGSATTADAVMQLNAKDGGHRKYIMVQLPERIEENKPAYKAGYRSIDEIGKARIEKAAQKIKEETGADIDYGYKLFYLENLDETMLMDFEDFEPTIKLIADDMVSIFDNEHSSGKESILATWLAEDGYGLSRSTEPYRLEGYTADRIENTLYIIDEGLQQDDAMTIIKRIENEELDITRLVIYAHSVPFHILHELRKNLNVLRNNKNVTMIERF